MGPVTAYLGLGSNLGRRDQNLATALRRLCRDWVQAGDGQARDSRSRSAGEGRVELLRASSIYETAPWGYACQPDFLNCVLEVRIALPPGELLAWIKGVERDMGRRPGLRYGPRLIDVDILLYGDVTVDQPDLQIPHPLLHQRAFALIPLAELNQQLVHPTRHATVAELAARVAGREGVRLWGPPPEPAQGDRGAQSA